MRRALFAALILGFLQVGVAEADIITYAFSGNISQASDAALVGTPFAGTFAYDTNPTHFSSATNSSQFTSAAADVTVTFGGNSYDADAPMWYGTSNDVGYSGFQFPDATYDGLDFFSRFTPVGGFSAMDLQLVDADLDVFSGNASVLPGTLDPFDHIQFSIGGDLVNAAGLVTSFQEQQPVPEPASLLLLGTGLIGLARAHRRRR